MHVKIVINMDNAAFDDGNNGIEVSRILSNLIKWIDQDEFVEGTSASIKDINGNKCGILEVKKGDAK